MTSIIIAVVVIVVAVYFITKRTSLFNKGKLSASLPGAKRNLREQCRSLLKMPPDEADKVIDRLIERQKEKNPGQTEEWYLDKVLFDLEKDKYR